MKKIYALLGITICIILFIQTIAVGQAQINLHKADSIIQSLINNKDIVGGIAAMSINGEICYHNAVGMKDKEASQKFDLSTLTRAASIAKPITAVAIMQLVEQGKLDLDVPIQTYIPNYPKSSKGEITTRHLLNHTSGIAAYASTKEAQTTTTYATLQDASAVFEDRELLFAPGSKYHYSTYGYVVLGRVIEEVSGQSYNEYVRQHIFDKAGMSNTSIEVYKKQYSDKSSLYHKRKNGKLIKVNKQNNLSNRIPGGGFHTTAEDMIKFGNAVLDETLVSNKSLTDMWTDGKVRPREEGNPYAKGWFLYGENPTYGRVIGHSGGQSGCSSQLMVLPDINAVVIVLANTSGSWNAVVNSSVQLYYCLPAPQPRSSN